MRSTPRTASPMSRLDASINWRFMTDVALWTLDQALHIQSIPAPTFAEHARAHWVASAFRALGLAQVEVDEYFNVYGLLAASAPAAGRGVMISAHTDTIFAQQTDLTTRREGQLVFGPGLGDNSIGVAGLLGLIEALRRTGVPFKRDLWLVATTREEGLGDLGGMRAAFERLHGQIDRVINLEGLAFGHVYYAGIAVRRLHITASAPGGHSWLHYGRPSAIHSLLQLGSQITSLPIAQTPRTTLNVGMIEGGEAINAIAAHAGLWLDMRSEEHGALNVLERQVRAVIASCAAPGLEWSVEVVGDRPAGAVEIDHPLVLAALAALEQVGTRGILERGSTDANVPLAAGMPAVTVGITRGGNAHRLDEYIETNPIAQGMRHLTLLTLHQALGGEA